MRERIRGSQLKEMIIWGLKVERTRSPVMAVLQADPAEGRGKSGYQFGADLEATLAYAHVPRSSTKMEASAFL